MGVLLRTAVCYISDVHKHFLEYQSIFDEQGHAVITKLLP